MLLKNKNQALNLDDSPTMHKTFYYAQPFYLQNFITGIAAKIWMIHLEYIFGSDSIKYTFQP